MKATVRYHNTPIRMSRKQNIENKMLVKMWNRKLTFTVGGSTNGTAT